MIHKHIIWQGIYYQSMESCNLFIEQDHIKIESKIIGTHQDIVYDIEYIIVTNKNWKVLSFNIKTQLNEEINILEGKKDSKNWIINGELKTEFQSCIDIDISLTPFTNTLPINRLNLKEKDALDINVLYIDVLGQRIDSTIQKYTKLSSTKYLYENKSSSFQEQIEVDQIGIIVNYPNLFKRIDINSLIIT